MDKLYQKRMLWIGFFVVFFMLIPILFTYAFGYKYNWDKHKFEATGILFIKTYPRDAQIILNDELMDDKTPFQQPKLLPGSYNLKIVKNDYLPWEKNIIIRPQTTTFIEDVVLYKRALPTPISRLELTDYLSANKQQYIILGNVNNVQQLIKYDVHNHNWEILKEFPIESQVALTSVSPDLTKLIFTQDNIYKLLLINSPEIESNLTGLANSYWENIVWSTDSENIIYTKIGSRLNEINISTLPPTITNSTSNIIDYFTHAGSIYYIMPSSDNTQVVLEKADRGLKNQEPILLLPYTSDISYVQSEDILTIIDEINSFLYLIDLKQDDIIAQVYPNTQNATWYDINYDKILFWNNNELNVYYKDRQETQLINRVSQSISNAWWHPNGTYAFYQIDNTIFIVEFDTRDKKNSYEIVTLKNDTPFIINDKGDEIVYYTREAETLYKQAIQ